ncbi:MAG TPA: hypothetical protein VHG32_16145 [Thermoanaerobaculia bacterium]|nr:hypothetical protein [Thermoanaerobaculia bacterium]
MRLSRSATILILGLSLATAARAQDDFDLWISEELLKGIVDSKSLLYSMEMTLQDRSNVHRLASDCEMHLAAVPQKAGLTAPKSFVVEPPNLCKNKPPDGSKSWEAFADANLLAAGEACTITGFPRILDEHLHGDEMPSNPHHGFELHPATQITCGAVSLDTSGFLRHYPGMAEIKPASAASCFEMAVRVRRNVGQRRYELQVDRPSTCGNFFSYEMSIFTEWIRSINGSGPPSGHSAIARVRPAGQNGDKTLKIYTLPGTPEDTLLEQWKTAGTAEPHHGAFFYGLTTIDYFAIWKTVTDKQHNPRDVPDWTNVPFPLAMVVFGSVDDPNPEADEGGPFE